MNEEDILNFELGKREPSLSLSLAAGEEPGAQAGGWRAILFCCIHRSWNLGRGRPSLKN